MKSKKLSKKLNLNKSTVVDLEMKRVKGGCRPSEPSACPTVTCPSVDHFPCCIPKTEFCTLIC